MPDTEKPEQLSAEELKSRFVKACELQEAGNPNAALDLYREVLSFIPRSPILHYNMGLANFEIKEFKQAAEHYDIACAENPADPDIYYNMGLNFRRLQENRKAITAFSKSLEIGEFSIDTVYNMALSHQELKEYELAAKLYDNLLIKEPEHLATLNNYAYLCHKTEALQKAEGLYRRLLQQDPDHNAAKHMLDSLLGITPDSAPSDYIESVFDNYAENFEDSLLNELHYRTPTELWKFFNELFPDHNNLKCLDLGCGTGLAGVAFNPACSELTGIDLSDKILAVAQQKLIYNELSKNDIVTYLKNSNEKYDLFIAADVFTYIGNLVPLLQICRERCEDSGLLCFSVEHAAGDTFLLKNTGRFGHSPEYVKKICSTTGWTLLSSRQSRLRQDKGEWICGHLFMCQK